MSLSGITFNVSLQIDLPNQHHAGQVQTLGRCVGQVC